MPLGKNIRYRFKTTKNDGVRLAFDNNKVVEVVPFVRVSGILKKKKGY